MKCGWFLVLIFLAVTVCSRRMHSQICDVNGAASVCKWKCGTEYEDVPVGICAVEGGHCCKFMCAGSGSLCLPASASCKQFGYQPVQSSTHCINNGKCCIAPSRPCNWPREFSWPPYEKWPPRYAFPKDYILPENDTWPISWKQMPYDTYMKSKKSQPPQSPLASSFNPLVRPNAPCKGSYNGLPNSQASSPILPPAPEENIIGPPPPPPPPKIPAAPPTQTPQPPPQQNDDGLLINVAINGHGFPIPNLQTTIPPQTPPPTNVPPIPPKVPPVPPKVPPVPPKVPPVPPKLPPVPPKLPPVPPKVPPVPPKVLPVPPKVPPLPPNVPPPVPPKVPPVPPKVPPMPPKVPPMPPKIPPMPQKQPQVPPKVPPVPPKVPIPPTTPATFPAVPPAPVKPPVITTTPLPAVGTTETVVVVPGQHKKPPSTQQQPKPPMTAPQSPELQPAAAAPASMATTNPKPIPKIQSAVKLPFPANKLISQASRPMPYKQQPIQAHKEKMHHYKVNTLNQPKRPALRPKVAAAPPSEVSALKKPGAHHKPTYSQSPSPRPTTGSTRPTKPKSEPDAKAPYAVRPPPTGKPLKGVRSTPASKVSFDSSSSTKPTKALPTSYRLPPPVDSYNGSTYQNPNKIPTYPMREAKRDPRKERLRLLRKKKKKAKDLDKKQEQETAERGNDSEDGLDEEDARDSDDDDDDEDDDGDDDDDDDGDGNSHFRQLVHTRPYDNRACDASGAESLCKYSCANPYEEVPPGMCAQRRQSKCCKKMCAGPGTMCLREGSICSEFGFLQQTPWQPCKDMGVCCAWPPEPPNWPSSYAWPPYEEWPPHYHFPKSYSLPKRWPDGWQSIPDTAYPNGATKIDNGPTKSPHVLTAGKPVKPGKLKIKRPDIVNPPTHLTNATPPPSKPSTPPPPPPNKAPPPKPAPPTPPKKPEEPKQPVPPKPTPPPVEQDTTPEPDAPPQTTTPAPQEPDPTTTTTPAPAPEEPEPQTPQQPQPAPSRETKLSPKAPKHPSRDKEEGVTPMDDPEPIVPAPTFTGPANTSIPMTSSAEQKKRPKKRKYKKIPNKENPPPTLPKGKNGEQKLPRKPDPKKGNKNKLKNGGSVSVSSKYAKNIRNESKGGKASDGYMKRNQKPGELSTSVTNQNTKSLKKPNHKGLKTKRHHHARYQNEKKKETDNFPNNFLKSSRNSRKRNVKRKHSLGNKLYFF